MRDVFRAPLRAAAVAAFTVGTLLFLVNPPSLSGAEDLIAMLGGALALVLVTAWGTVALMGDGPDEREFERIVRRSEATAADSCNIAEFAARAAESSAVLRRMGRAGVSTRPVLTSGPAA